MDKECEGNCCLIRDFFRHSKDLANSVSTDLEQQAKKKRRGGGVSGMGEATIYKETVCRALLDLY